MNRLKNREIIQEMYKTTLNQKQFDKSDLFVDKDYVEEFNSANKPLFTAFPDIKFTIKEIFEDGNKVVTLYDWSGTHKYEFHNIAATHKNVTVEGMSIYELENGKITHNVAKPDKLSLFQQLGVIPQDFLNNNTNPKEAVYFIDEFEIPKKSFHDFKEKLDYNRSYIKNLEGFIKDDVMIQKEDSSQMIILTTIAVWENQKSLDKAKKLVQSEYKRIGFNPTKFHQKLNIKMSRRTYSLLE